MCAQATVPCRVACGCTAPVPTTVGGKTRKKLSYFHLYFPQCLACVCVCVCMYTRYTYIYVYIYSAFHLVEMYSK